MEDSRKGTDKSKYFPKEESSTTKETEIEVDGTLYIKKSKYMRLQRRIFLLESYMNATREQIDSIKHLLKEIKDE